MDTFTKPILAIGLFGMLSIGVQAEVTPWPESILVITSDSYAVSKPTILHNTTSSLKILNLDRVSHIEERLSKNLPADAELARAEVDRRITSIGKTQIESELRSAYEAVSAAMAYRLDRYPAIIFDGQLVVYGVTDLSAAMNIYRDWSLGLGEESSDE